MNMSKSTFHPREKQALAEFKADFIELCKDSGISFGKKKANTVLAYLENPFNPRVLAEVDVVFCWDVLSTMERDEFLECLYQHFAFLMRRQSMLS